MTHFKNLNAIKWVALVLMAGDHVNKYLFNETLPFLFEAGRAVMPMFCFVLAYNLARPDALANGTYQRVVNRLVIFGLMASPAYILLGGVIDDWWPLNILFTLLTITLVIYFIDRGGRKNQVFALLVFMLCGAVVEFWWPAVLMGVFLWLFFRYSNPFSIAGAVLACASLWYINDNFYALLSVPLVLILSRTPFSLPRFKWFFYAFYPLHLYALMVIRVPMAKAGYLFFT
ncbi:TraX family protein [Pantoea agglomerans]|uniref:TraX family protein n=1 Tax=Enterobacter agglomerans TaxID=549 RepID=UPI003C7A70C9